MKDQIIGWNPKGIIYCLTKDGEIHNITVSHKHHSSAQLAQWFAHLPMFTSERELTHFRQSSSIFKTK